MVDAGLSFPVPLKDADLSEPFVYYRKYGVFYVPKQKHHFAMAQLLAWEMGAECYMDLDHDELNIIGIVRQSDIYSYSYYFLSKFAGTAYKSSLKNVVRIGDGAKLNDFEIDIFGLIEKI